MLNAVFGETSGSDIPLDHGPEALKHSITLNSKAGHENLKNYIRVITDLGNM